MIEAFAIITLCLICLISFWLTVMTLRKVWEVEMDLECLKNAIQCRFEELYNEVVELKITNRRRQITSSKKRK